MWKHENAPQLNFTGDKIVVQSYDKDNIVKREMSKEEARKFLDRYEDEHTKEKVIEEGNRLEIGNPEKWMGRLANFGKGTITKIEQKKLDKEVL